MNTPDLNDLTTTSTIPQLQQQMEEGSLTALALTQHYLTKIEARNPELNAIISITPDVAAMAQALDAERSERGARGPLHGIPILIKDNIETVELPTTAGRWHSGITTRSTMRPAWPSCARLVPSSSARPT